MGPNKIQVTVFSMFWGEQHLRLFQEACFRSLHWPKNIKALKEHAREWVVYTKREHFEAVKEIFKNSPIRLGLMELGEKMVVAGIGELETQKCDASIVLLNGLRSQIQLCLEGKTRMLLAPPDTVFGDGTVLGLLAAGQDPGTAVMVPHPRVLPEFVEELGYRSATDGAMDNPKLVTLAMKHAHDAWRLAERGHERNNSFVGGVLWEEISPGLYEVRHRLPTAYLIDFMPEDFDFWWAMVGFGALDHRWPGENLIRQERMRYVGSSDSCFIVEITDRDKNVPQETPAQVRKSVPADFYFNNRLHNSVNRLFLSYFRGE